MFAYLKMLLRLTLFIVLGGFIVAFVTANGQPVQLSFYPLPYEAELPLHALCLALLLLGAMLGASVVWFGNLKRQLLIGRRNRKQTRQLRALENEIKSIRMEETRYGLPVEQPAIPPASGHAGGA